MSKIRQNLVPMFFQKILANFFPSTVRPEPEPGPGPGPGPGPEPGPAPGRLLTETSLQVFFVNKSGPDVDGFWALDVYPEVTRTFHQASTRCLPTLSEDVRGSRAETLLDKIQKNI